MKKFPNTQSQEWLALKERTLKMTEEFKAIREAYLKLYESIDFERFDELGGKRQPKILMKMNHFPGDITPTMLVSLINDVENSPK
jgi:hypothetical protein